MSDSVWIQAELVTIYGKLSKIPFLNGDDNFFTGSNANLY
jgi:hypothetical protein